VNAAFLLVASAWLAGDAPPGGVVNPPPANPPPVAAPVAAPATSCSSCSGYSGYSGYDSGCGCQEGCFARLRGLFSHGNDCGCASTPSCGFSHGSSCGCEGEGLFSHFRGHWGSTSDCGCNQASSCGCESGCFLDRLRSHFHRNDCGCDTGCSTNGYNTTTAPVTQPGEPIKPPKDSTEPGKKLPEGDKPKDKEAKAPAPFEVAPTTTKVIEKDNRNPY
jgi:hypothetical protein